MKQYGVVLFHTTSAVMRAEKALLEQGFEIRLIPTPRQFSSDCGIALRFDWDRLDAVTAVFQNMSIEFDTIHSIVDKN